MIEYILWYVAIASFATGMVRAWVDDRPMWYSAVAGLLFPCLALSGLGYSFAMWIDKFEVKAGD